MANNAAATPAGKRIELLLDGKSFVEIGGAVTARNTDLNTGAEKAPGDGVICGYGLIDGSLVYVYAEDASVLGGSLGEMHAKKICSIYDLALKTGAPVIGLLDSSGFRLREGADALEAAGAIYRRQALASGVIPQITAVFGTCGGGMALLPGLSDFTFMENDARLFVNAPNAIDNNRAEVCNTAAAAYQMEKGGIVDGVGSEEEILASIRELVSLLPSNNDENAVSETEDDLNRACTGLASAGGDALAMLRELSDDGIVVEKAPGFAKEMVTALISLNGMTVGTVANSTKSGDDTFAPRLTPKGAEKAAEFISFCDAFSIPVLTLTNLVGYASDKCAETRMAACAAKLAAALADADVPKVSLITGKALGSAYVVMNSKGIGADMVYAWPNAEVGPMEADMAAKVLCPDAGAEELKEKEAEFRALQNNVAMAAARGYVDAVIEPADSRKYLIGAFEMLFTKREDRPLKKHSTVR